MEVEHRVVFTHQRAALRAFAASAAAHGGTVPVALVEAINSGLGAVEISSNRLQEVCDGLLWELSDGGKDRQMQGISGYATPTDIVFMYGAGRTQVSLLFHGRVVIVSAEAAQDEMAVVIGAAALLTCPCQPPCGAVRSLAYDARLPLSYLTSLQDSLVTRLGPLYPNPNQAKKVAAMMTTQLKSQGEATEASRKLQREAALAALRRGWSPERGLVELKKSQERQAARAARRAPEHRP